MIKKILTFLKRPPVYISLIVLVLIGAGFFFSSGKKDTSTIVAIAERKTVEQIVSVTGNVKASSYVNLAFEKSGRVKNIFVNVGDKVSAGAALVSLDSGDLASQLNQANASLKAQQARLEQLKAGGSVESIAIAKVELTNAQNTLEDSKKSAFDTLSEVITVIDDTVRNKADGFFSNPESSSPHFNLSVDSILRLSLENKRVGLQAVLSKKNKPAATLINESFNFDGEFTSAKSDLNKVKSFLDDLAAAVNSLTANSSLSQTTIDSYKSTVSSARSAIDTQIAAVTTAEKLVRTSEASLSLEESQLTLAQNPARPEEIRAQEAGVEEAQANVTNVLVQLGKTTLRSPINGVITKKNIQVGEIVSGNSAVIAVISSDKFEIETNMPEADIAKIGVDNEATVTLDAYGRDVVFPTKVIAVDPAETVIDGVSTYKVTLRFLEEDERIKSGMTANVDIVTGRKENVITIPQRAVVRSDGEKIVRVRLGEIIEERKIETGLVGFDGAVEVVSGLLEGEEVIVFSVK